METSKQNNKQNRVKSMDTSYENKLKILLLGPVSTGKTVIANFLSDSTENPAGETRPTKGVRIVEFVVPGIKAKSVYQKSVEVELWDCSGDNRYQSCWLAMQHKANGIIFVYTEASNRQKSILNDFYEFFVKRSNFPKINCFVVKNQLQTAEDVPKDFEENPLPYLNHAIANIDSKGIEFKKQFNSFLSTILKSGSNE